jgi:hypothetical protein
MVLLLWWLLAQLRTRRLGEVLVDSGDGAGALLRGRALEEALGTEAASLDGVDRAQVRLTGRRTAPQARLAVSLGPAAAPAEALHRLTAEALAHARGSAGLARFPAEIRFRATRHGPQRVT